MTSKPWLKHYDPGVPARLDYPAVPVFHFLDEGARLSPGRTCLIYRNERRTYQEVSIQSDQLAAALSELGIRKGERVGIFMANSPDFILAYFGILKAGAVVVAINPLFTPREIAVQVNDAEVRTVFCSSELYGRLKTAQPETGITQVIMTGDGEVLAGDQKVLELYSGMNPKGLNEKDRKSTSGFKTSSNKIEIVPEDIALFQYTGGTTGIPKAAVARHRNLVANALQFKAWMSTLKDGQETVLLALPIYHIYGMVCGMLLGMALRASLVIIPNPRDISELLSAIQTEHVSYFPAAPTLYNAINNAPEVSSGKVDLASIKACISGSAPLMRSTKEKFEQLTGGRILEGYGLSEAPTATHCNPLRGDNRIGSIGLPLPDVDARIVNLEDGSSEMPAGEIGELVLQSPQVMLGYHNQPSETEAVLKGGWLHTGDIARMDADGYFYIVDRKKDLIKPGGMEVWPREIEERIAAHPKVAEVAVAGIPDAYRGETVKAWVVLKPGEKLSEAQVQAWCREGLAAFKVPTVVVFRQQLPKSTVGKVLKRVLVREG
jgi:long-chain acyl-CoA synthetase